MATDPTFLLMRIALVAYAGLTCGTAVAQNRAPAAGLGGEVALVSDYRFRGVSFSGGGPAVQAEVELGLKSGWFAGMWGSRTLDRSRRDTEVDLYAGRSGGVGSFNYTLAFYAYSDGDLRRISYAELRTILSHQVGPASLELEASGGTRQSQGGPRNLYLGLTSRTPIGAPGFSAVIHAGYENGFFRRKVDYEAGAEYVRARWTLSASITGSFRPSVADIRPLEAQTRRGAALLASISRVL